jgi:hypothetical protein
MTGMMAAIIATIMMTMTTYPLKSATRTTDSNEQKYQ